MTRVKQGVLRRLRRIGFLTRAEWFHRHVSILRHRQDNARFCRQNPAFAAPPLAAMHDAYGSVSFRSYWEEGQAAARLIAGLISQHHPKAQAVLEWGCGSARILRHLPTLMPDGCAFVGIDYNPESIAWCQRSVAGVSFVRNDLSPPAPLEAQSFDAICAVSVLTHLAAAQQNAWIAELRRLLRPQGCLIVTVHGEKSAKLLLPDEAERFKAEGIVIRDKVEEGKRCFLSYHHPRYVRERLFQGMKVRAHIEASPDLWGPTGVEQDIWVVQEA